MENRTDQAAKDKVLSLIKDSRIAMMATKGDDGRMHSRPMATNTVAFDGEIWFLTDIHSPKVAEIERDAEVLLAYADEGDQHYVSITGRAEVIKDSVKARELWWEGARVWFPKGPTDPDLALIKVHVEVAEYWDSPSSTMVYAYGYLKALATGERPQPGGNATVRF